MANDIQIFENIKLGKLRTIIKDNEPYFVGKEWKKALTLCTSNNILIAWAKSEVRI